MRGHPITWKIKIDISLLDEVYFNLYIIPACTCGM